jgi:hypothetical protein
MAQIRKPSAGGGGASISQVVSGFFKEEVTNAVAVGNDTWETIYTIPQAFNSMSLSFAPNVTATVGLRLQDLNDDYTVEEWTMDGPAGIEANRIYSQEGSEVLTPGHTYAIQVQASIPMNNIVLLVELYAETLPYDLHLSLDHTGIPGVSGGSFTQEAHDQEDHTGLPGIPSAFITVMALESSLPTVEVQQFCTAYNHAQAVGSATGTYTSLGPAGSERAVKAVVGSPYSTVTVRGRVKNDAVANITPTFKIYGDTDGKPGTLLASANGSVLADANAWNNISHDFTLDPPLEAGTYWIAIPGDKAGLYCTGGGAAVGTQWDWQTAGVWDVGAADVGLSISAEGMPDLVYADGDIVFTQDTNKFWRWNFDTLSWIELNPTTDLTGLLDEAAHDQLDHAGLPGIPDVSAFSDSWKDPVVNEAALPANSDVTVLNHWTDTSPGSWYDNISGSVWGADDFLGDGLDDYTVKLKLKAVGGNSGSCAAHIYSDGTNKPGTLVANSDEANSGVIENGVTQDTTFHFTQLNLVDGTKYYVVITSVTGLIQPQTYTGGIEDNSVHSTNAGSSWSTNNKVAIDMLVKRAGTVVSYEGDVRYAEAEKTTWIFDGTNWNQIGDITGLLDESAHDALDHTGLTGVNPGQWLGSVADEANLPGALGNYATYGAATVGFYDNWGSWHADDFVGNGLGYYKFVEKLAYGGANLTLRAFIYSNNAGVPGTLVAQCDADITGVNDANQDIIFEFTDVDLTEGTTYWLVTRKMSGGDDMEKSANSGGNAQNSGNSGASWNAAGGYSIYMQAWFAASGNILGDLILQRDTGAILFWNGSDWTATI